MPKRSLHVGRGDSNDLCLSSQSSSRRHARLDREENYLFVTDLGSRNGTFINDTQLIPHKVYALSDKDELRLGQTTRFSVTGCISPNVTLVAPSVDNRDEHVKKDGGKTRFGFSSNRVEFEAEGVGRDAAAKLTQRFRLIQVLAEGGMGKIILVQEILSGRFVAMKVMLEKATREPSLVQQFVREAVITARLQHPHIIPVHDLGFLQANQLYYTMSYIENSNFSALIPTIDIPERIRILRCAALAVNHAHSKHLWHRDLKPQNILVGTWGDTYVIDWGLVSVQPKKDYKLNIPNVVVRNMDLVIPDNLINETADAITGQTNAGAVIGTPLYMSPEQIVGNNDFLGVQSDVWAFGVMLFQALTGVHPYHLGTKELRPRVIFNWTLQDDMPSPEEVNCASPRELTKLFLGMVVRERELRDLNLDRFISITGDYLADVGYAVTRYDVRR